jgi:hypothetical protein
MASHLLVSVVAPDATKDEVADITRELANWIGDAAPACEVAQETMAGPAGAKGILEVLGSLGVKLLEPGALKSLIDCLAVYIKERRRQVSIKLQTTSGASITLRAGGVGRGELDEMLRQLQQMVGGGPAAHA